ncbi:Gfo/Idh/MocA family protein [Dyadobacter tibetensis]|uniref:Gfo/Idh/MocA family protein n=1 Tax=Dyadobacter tibetensis TaxID=1211851 RepID=UPI000472D565|nr:Gfo/Idh/MocA family oxidoreductase [Dyadobacter tibetensis]
MNARRDFLQKLTLGLGLTAMSDYSFGSVANMQEPTAERPLRVALMGLGGYANIVAKGMQECKMAVITGLISGTPSKLKSWQEKYNVPEQNTYSYETMHRIKDNPDIDLVYVITPNSLHHKHVLQVAATGKHVLCEKPLADNAQQAREMISACEKAGVKLYVGYRLHFEPHTREVIRMREEGAFGKIMHVNNYMGFTIGDPTQWRLKKALAGGGALMDVGVYSLNAARYCTGEEPIWVTAQESKTDPVKFREVDETITFQLGFPSGIIANCGCTYNFGHSERLHLMGTKGWAEMVPAFGYGPIKGNTHLGPIDQPKVNHQTYQMDGIAACILNNEPDPNVTGQEGLKDMIVIDAIYESIKKGGQKIVINA